MNEALTAVLTAISAYVLLLLVLYFFQERLIFPGAYLGLSPSILKASDAIFLEDAPRLEGWGTAAASPDSDVIVIYFAGNGDEAGSLHNLFAMFQAHRVYSFNYRGYGNSEGRPDEQGIINDALRVYDFVVRQYPEKRVVAMGHSMGSAVAGHLAIKRRLDGLVLLTPLASVTQIVRENFFGVVPSFLLKHPFDLAGVAPEILTPSLVLIAENDRTIPRSHSLTTFDALAGEKRLVVISGANHNSVFSSDAGYHAINEFLQQPKG